MGKNGLTQKLVKDVLENILEGEMEEHLGRNKYETVCTELDKKAFMNDLKDELLYCELINILSNVNPFSFQSQKWIFSFPAKFSKAY